MTTSDYLKTAALGLIAWTLFGLFLWIIDKGVL